MKQELISRQNLILLTLFSAIFFIIHGAWLFNFHGCIDDVILEDQFWLILARGKWAGWLFKTAFSHGPNYPYGAIFYGITISGAALLQCQALGLHQTWQKVAYAMLLLCSNQEISNIRLWVQNDVYALGIFASSAAAYFLSLEEDRKWMYAMPMLTISLGCYQTIGTYFFALFLAILLLRYLRARKAGIQQLIVRCAVTIILSLLLYFGINKCMTLLVPVPENFKSIAEAYESSLSGWGVFERADSVQKLHIFAHFGAMQPLLHFFEIRNGNWLFLSTLLPLIGVTIFLVKGQKIKEAATVASIGSLIIYIPFAFAPILLHHIAFEGRMMIAVPVCTACLWGVAFIAMEDYFRRHMHAYGLILVLTGVHALYLSGESARNSMFLFDRATEELRDMYMLARVEAKQHQLNDCDFLFCGIVPPNPRRTDIQSLCSTTYNLREGTALSFIFPSAYGTNNCFLRKYSSFMRIGQRMRSATETELAKHASKLHQMPSWPADGSVAADGNVVLIKLGDEMHPGIPLP